ncbi:MAG: hypothetical protein ACJA06_001646 [Halocynthiibacter sp.]|jgi:hypothetical protein
MMAFHGTEKRAQIAVRRFRPHKPFGLHPLKPAFKRY